VSTKAGELHGDSAVLLACSIPPHELDLSAAIRPRDGGHQTVALNKMRALAA